MKLRTLLVDDEPLALRRLRRLLQPHAQVIEVIGEASNGREAVAEINTRQPDLIFLDIQMPELNGFEVLERLEHLPLIIFSTAYDEYALRAFETNSIDYLLKPLDPERLQKAIDKLVHLTQDEHTEVERQMRRLMEQVRPPQLKRLQVRVGDKIRFLDLPDICFLRAEDKYVAVYTRNDSFLLSQSLSDLERQLPGDDFVRVHRSAIVNLVHVEEVVRLSAGSYQIRMKDRARSKIPVSRAAKSRLGL